MAFYRWRTVGKNRYLYLEERWRENGKVKSRSTLIKGDRESLERKLANERYRDVLRENVYRYGKSHTGERYRREAEARQAYHRYLDGEKRGSFKKDMEEMIERGTQRFEEGHAERQAKDEPLSSELPKGNPTDADEEVRAEALDYWNDWNGQQAEEYAATADTGEPSEGDS